MKICIKCGLEKEMSIHHVKDDKIFYRNVCIDCDKERNRKRGKIYSKEWYKNNKDLSNKASREWTKENKERKKELNKKRTDPILKEKYSIAKKIWRTNNPDKEKKYSENRIKNATPLQKLKNNMRNSIRLYLEREGFIKKSKTESILGCSFNEFKLHLESKFEPWMNWGNHGKFNGDYRYGWDIDHIIPLSNAKTENDIIKLNHYTNLQPLCGKVNRHEKRDHLLENIE